MQRHVTARLTRPNGGRVRGFVASWTRRFAEQRIAGLYSRHVGQVATVLTPELEAKMLEATRHTPPGGATQWNTRNLAARL